MATRRKKPSKSTRALARRPIVQAPLAQLPKGTGDRRALGRSSVVEALFPAPPPKAELPSGYAKVLGELKHRIEQTRLATVSEIAHASLPRDFGGSGTNRDTRFWYSRYASPFDRIA